MAENTPEEQKLSMAHYESWKSERPERVKQLLALENLGLPGKLALACEFHDIEREKAEREAKVERLEKMRQIGIDVEACIAECTCVPEFMKLAFTDAITASGEHQKEEGDG